MRIAVTGAAGHLGSHLCPLLAEQDHTLIRSDVRDDPGGPGEFRQADLTDATQARAAIEGADLVVHCASIHPWKQYSDSQYLDCNLKGTWHVFDAAHALGITRLVHTSSIAVYGEYWFPPDLWPVREDQRPGDPGDLYRVTKMAQETMARFFAASRGLRIAALRPPAFMPRDDLATGLALLGHFAVAEDIAAAHVAAVECLDSLPNAFEPFNVTNALPYTPDEGRRLLESPRPVIDYHWPGAWDYFVARSLTPAPRPTVFDLSRARRLLAWQPVHNFDTWWAEHQW
ncbi:MAG: NAD-dependent epimerase/dehydratase family protein [Planctomycetota bacterium]